MSGPAVTLRKDCLGGDKIVDVDVGQPLTPPHLDRVDGVSQRTVLAGLPRPFFRLDVAGRFLITGILGDASVRFTVRRELAEDAVDVALDAARQMLGAPSRDEGLTLGGDRP